MRILLASNGVVPHVGGIQTYFNNLSRYLEAAGHRADVLAWEPGKQRLFVSRALGIGSGGEWPGDRPDRAPRAVRAAGPEHVVDRAAVLEPLQEAIDEFWGDRCPPDQLLIPHREAERYAFELAAAQVPLADYDVLHAHDVVVMRALSRVRPRGVPLVGTVHGLLSQELLGLGMVQGRGSRGFRYVTLEERVGARSVDHMILPSRWMRGIAMNQWGVPARAIAVIPYGLDLKELRHRAAQPPAGSLPDRAGRRLILCPARLSPEKGQGLLLAALRLLARRRRDFVCWLAGAGPTRGSLGQRVERLGLEGAVEFLGNRLDVPSLLEQADVVVLPSRLDNLPHAVMEAQVAGRAVVATRVGGIPEMIQHRQTGWLVPGADPDALARALRRLLDDALLRQAIGERAAVWGLSAWDGERMGRATLAVYERLSRGRERDEARVVVGGAAVRRVAGDTIGRGGAD